MANENEYEVVGIEAVVGGGMTFVLARDPVNQLTLHSTSTVVQAAMLCAFFVGARVEPQLEGNTKVVRRVMAFGPGNGTPSNTGEYYVARVATQRVTNVGDHLEVFLMGLNDTTDKQYLVHDPMLQPLLLGALQHDAHSPIKVRIHVGFDDTEIVSIRLGQEPLARVAPRAS